MLRSSTSLPGFIAPQTPVLSAEPPRGGGWIHEIKHDGYRTLLRNNRGQVQAFTRNGNDWSDRYQRVVEACANLSCGSALIDGEVIVQNEKGVSDFAALRAAIDREPHRLVMLAFDLLFLNGQDLREANVSATLNGFGFELEGYMGTYRVTDRRAALDLPSAIQPVVCQSLDEVAQIFSIPRP